MRAVAVSKLSHTQKSSQANNRRELNEQRARASSVNFANVFTQRGSNQTDRIAQSRVIVGDGCDAETIISQVNTDLSSSVKISFLHLDPARPRNSRSHDISEMKPSLDQVFSGGMNVLNCWMATSYFA